VAGAPADVRGSWRQAGRGPLRGQLRGGVGAGPGGKNFVSGGRGSCPGEGKGKGNIFAAACLPVIWLWICGDAEGAAPPLQLWNRPCGWIVPRERADEGEGGRWGTLPPPSLPPSGSPRCGGGRQRGSCPRGRPVRACAWGWGGSTEGATTRRVDCGLPRSPALSRALPRSPASAGRLPGSHGCSRRRAHTRPRVSSATPIEDAGGASSQRSPLRPQTSSP